MAGALSIPWLSSCAKEYKVQGLATSPDENGLLLPPGCKSRVIAYADKKVGNTDYIWHSAPDGGGVFSVEKGGWIYISNSEMNDSEGGVSAIKFDADGSIVDAYPVLKGTNRNCGGCVTPWNTWLSCEEIRNGITWECDPTGRTKAIERPMLGVFNHESIAIDPKTMILYLTEDEVDGCFYRYVPDSVKNGIPDLSNGRLEVALLDASGKVTWKLISDPLAKQLPVRKQVSDASRFRGGEGIAYNEGVIYFDTKKDDRIWVYNIQQNDINVFYDAASYESPVLTGVDTIIMYNDTLLVCEDDGDMQVVAVTPEKNITPVLQLVGHDNSEITGVALSPDKTRLYFNSQRGKTGRQEDAVTYEVSGPFVS